MSSPSRTRIGALQMLHFRENVAQVLAVLPALAMPGMWALDRALESGLCEYFVQPHIPCRAHRRKSGRNAAIRHGAVQVILGEQLSGIGPKPFQSRLRPRAALLGAI